MIARGVDSHEGSKMRARHTVALVAASLVAVLLVSAPAGASSSWRFPGETSPPKFRPFSPTARFSGFRAAAAGNGPLAKEILSHPVAGWVPVAAHALDTTISSVQGIESVAARLLRMSAVAAGNAWRSPNGQLLVILLIAFVGKPSNALVTASLLAETKSAVESLCGAGGTVIRATATSSPPGYASACQAANGRLLVGDSFVKANILGIVASTATVSQIVAVTQRQYNVLPAHGLNEPPPLPKTLLSLWDSTHGAFLLRFTTDALHVLAQQIMSQCTTLAHIVKLAETLPVPPKYGATWQTMLANLGTLAAVCEHLINTRHELVADWTTARTSLRTWIVDQVHGGTPLGKRLFTLWKAWLGTIRVPISASISATIPTTPSREVVSRYSARDDS